MSAVSCRRDTPCRQEAQHSDRRPPAKRLPASQQLAGTPRFAPLRDLLPIRTGSGSAFHATLALDWQGGISGDRPAACEPPSPKCPDTQRRSFVPHANPIPANTRDSILNAYLSAHQAKDSRAYLSLFSQDADDIDFAVQIHAKISQLKDGLASSFYREAFRLVFHSSGFPGKRSFSHLLVTARKPETRRKRIQAIVTEAENAIRR